MIPIFSAVVAFSPILDFGMFKIQERLSIIESLCGDIFGDSQIIVASIL